MKPKFDIGETVYYLTMNKIVKAQVELIDCTITGNGLEDVVYILNNGDSQHEYNLHHTREALWVSLNKEYHEGCQGS